MKGSTMKYKCLCCRALFIWIRTGSWEADIPGWCKMSIIWNRINKHGGANNKRKCWPFQVNKAWLMSEWLIGLVYSILIVIDSPFSFSSTCFTLTSVCTFSILFSILFIRCWQGEFVWQSRVSLVGDHFLYYGNLNVWLRDSVWNYTLVTLGVLELRNILGKVKSWNFP